MASLLLPTFQGAQVGTADAPGRPGTVPSVPPISGGGAGADPTAPAPLPPPIDVAAIPTAPTPPPALLPYASQTLPASTGTPGGFDDPYTKQFIDYLQQVVAKLQQPIQQTDYSGVVSAGNSLLGGYTNPNEGTLESTLRGIISQDTAPDVWSGTQLAGLKADAFSTIEQNRQAALRQETARLAALGHGPASGTLTANLAAINQQFDQQRAAQVRDLLTKGVTQANRNQDTAASAAEQLFAAPNTVAQLDASRKATGGSLIAQAGAGSLNQQQAQTNNLLQAVNLLKMPVDLQDSRLQTALAALKAGGQTDPAQILQLLTTLSQQTGSNNSAFYTQLGSLLSGLGK